jgi:ribulose-5-phosphate 4-epimerase/fuculose-1-phosphate aldolase
MTEESKAREALTSFGKSMFERGLSFGSAGNLSMRIEGGWLMTPTNVSLGRLDPARISRLDENGRHVGGDAPTKESLLHLAMYGARKSAGAIVHLHSTHSVAVSVIDGLDPDDAIPPITAYYVMRVGKLKLLPYYPPGDPALADAVGAVAARHSSVLLANHGPIVAGTSLEAAVNAVEELEETAKLFLLLRGQPTRFLTEQQVAALAAKYPIP